MLFKISPQPFRHALCDSRSHAAVAEFSLGLTLELRLRELDGDDRGQTLSDVLAGELVRLFQNARLPAVVVDDLGDGCLESVKVRAALLGVDVVGKGKDGVRIRIVILHRHLDLAVHVVRVEIDHALEDGLLVAVEALHKGDDAALIAEDLVPCGLNALVRDLDGETFVEIGKLSQPRLHGVVVEVQRLEDVAVGIERDGGAGVRSLSDHRERTLRHAAVETDAVELAALPDLRDQPLRERVDAGHAHAVQTARDLIAAAAEFAAGVQLGEHDFDSRFPFLFDDADGDAAPVVRDAHRAVGQDLHRNVRAIARERLVDGVVHHFRHEMMEPSCIRRADVHPGTLPHRVQPFQHLDVRRIIAVFDFFHASSLR